MDIFNDMLEVYMRLQGGNTNTNINKSKNQENKDKMKKCAPLSALKFSKLASLPKLTTAKFPKTCYDILYKTTMRNAQDKNKMTFNYFI